jgi:hypothetical protein
MMSTFLLEKFLVNLIAAILSHPEVDGTRTIRPVELFKSLGWLFVKLGICSFSPETGNQFSQNGKDLFEDFFGGELEIGFSQKDGKKKYEIARGNFDFSFLLGGHCFRFYYTTFDDGKQWFIIQVDNEDIEDSSVAAFCQDGMFQIVRCRLSENAPFVQTSSSVPETSVQNAPVEPLFDPIPDSERPWVMAVMRQVPTETSVQGASAPETSVQGASAPETSVQGASAPDDDEVRLSLIEELPIAGNLKMDLVDSSIKNSIFLRAKRFIKEQSEMEEYFRKLLSEEGSSSA